MTAGLGTQGCGVDWCRHIHAEMRWNAANNKRWGKHNKLKMNDPFMNA